MCNKLPTKCGNVSDGVTVALPASGISRNVVIIPWVTSQRTGNIVVK